MFHKFVILLNVRFAILAKGSNQRTEIPFSQRCVTFVSSAARITSEDATISPLTAR